MAIQKNHIPKQKVMVDTACIPTRVFPGSTNLRNLKMKAEIKLVRRGSDTIDTSYGERF